MTAVTLEERVGFNFSSNFAVCRGAHFIGIYKHLVTVIYIERILSLLQV